MHEWTPLITFFPGDEDAPQFAWHHGGYPTRAWLLDALRAVGFSRTEVIYRPSFRWAKKLAALVTNTPQRGRLIVHAFADPGGPAARTSRRRHRRRRSCTTKAARFGRTGEMTILITGGAGYIGSHMVHALVDQGERVVVVDNLSTGFRWAIPADVPLVEGDTGDADAMRSAMETHGVELIIHFAASIVVPESVADPLGYYRNNTANSRTLIEAAVRAGVRHFIFSSTAAVYGNPTIVPVPEEATLAPMSPYGSSKMMTEIILRDTTAAHGLQHVILRYFNVAGADPRAAHRTIDPRRHPPDQGRGRDRARHPAENRRVRHRLSDPRRYLHPRLHPRDRPDPARIPMRCATCAKAVCRRRSIAATDAASR